MKDDNVIAFPMGQRMKSIFMARAAYMIREQIDMSEIDDDLAEELRLSILDVVEEFIDENDPTKEEVEEFVNSFSQPEMQIVIIEDNDPDNDNEED